MHSAPHVGGAKGCGKLGIHVVHRAPHVGGAKGCGELGRSGLRARSQHADPLPHVGPDRSVANVLGGALLEEPGGPEYERRNFGLDLTPARHDWPTRARPPRPTAVARLRPTLASVQASQSPHGSF